MASQTASLLHRMLVFPRWRTVSTRNHGVRGRLSPINDGRSQGGSEIRKAGNGISRLQSRRDGGVWGVSRVRGVPWGRVEKPERFGMYCDFSESCYFRQSARADLPACGSDPQQRGSAVHSHSLLIKQTLIHPYCILQGGLDRERTPRAQQDVGEGPHVAKRSC